MHHVCSSLRVFGSKCFPYTWNTRHRKFDPKTVLCIFVGYSDKYKGYKCFHPTSKQFIISYHVVFDELIFPYKKTHSTGTTLPSFHVISIFNSWIPPATDSSAEMSLLKSSSVCLLIAMLQKGSSQSFDVTLITPSLPFHDVVPTHTMETTPPTSYATHKPQTLSLSKIETVQLPSQAEADCQIAPSTPIVATTAHQPCSSFVIEPVKSVSLSTEENSSLPQPSAVVEAASVTPPTPPHLPAAHASHPMMTRSQHGILKPNPKYALISIASTNVPREPRAVCSALAHQG